MKILFVCKHNRFRSQVAETIFKKLNKQGWEAESAGLKLDELRPYIEKNVIKIMEEKGYEIKGKPRKLSPSLINKFDIVVIVADNANIAGFKGKIVRWKIHDTNANNITGIKKIIEEIEGKVKGLILELNKKIDIFIF